jgi:hypothetical protein
MSSGRTVLLFSTKLNNLPFSQLWYCAGDNEKEVERWWSCLLSPEALSQTFK